MKLYFGPPPIEESGWRHLLWGLQVFALAMAASIALECYAHHAKLEPPVVEQTD